VNRLLVWKTRIGPFYIAQGADGRFHPLFDGEDLGSYGSVALAVADLAGGHASSARGIDIAALGISDNPAEWRRLAE
jgi:hypothetical protein